jgi:hypothetical protein
MAGNKGPSIAMILAGAALAALIPGCQSTAYKPAFPDQATLRVTHAGNYSSKFAQEEKEFHGTQFQTNLTWILEKQGSGWVMKRRLDTLHARGYHKLSMPHEVEKKVNLDVTLDSGRMAVKIQGYDSLAKVLGRIDQKEEFRKELLKGADTAFFSAWLRDWFRMLAFLPTGREFEMHEKLPVDDLNKRLETLKIDSARYDAMRWRGVANKRNCLEYILEYHRTDSLPLLVEQFFFSNVQNRKYRKYSWKPGTVKGFLQFSVERDSGLPCFHARSEIGDITLEYKPEKGDKAEVPIQLIRYEEELYER